ncbi:enoyl-CoA hydratase/isomerase family protein [Kocuria sp. CPCC 205235]|uniref:enoyl-CoA hydratase/isomerase family protein n=1 Tax=Kocuria sp. CPCC 205235 TaxID=3073549 RepID=UPI0034D4910A
MTTSQENFVRAEIVGGTGVLTLTREKALNALSRSMYHQIAGALQDWAKDPAITQVVMQSTLPKALCAGGDIKEVREAALDGRSDEVEDTFGTEYAMDNLIAEYPKPYVAMMNGIVMGGGMGISVHGSHRIVSETTLMAMPETAIGFFTDIGASHFLPRVSRETADGARETSLEFGRYLGLSGARFNGADAIALGLADTYISSSDAEAFVELTISDGVDAAVAKFGQEPPASEIITKWDEIQETYGGDSLEAIVERTGSDLDGMSPTSLVRVFELLNAGAKDDSVRSCLERELSMATVAAQSKEFLEGVRAMVVDKDKNPQWSPATVAEVDAEEVRRVVERKMELPF